MYNIIDKNFNHHISMVAGITVGMAVIRQRGITYVDSGLNCDTFNIIHITDGSTVREKDIADAVHYFKQRLRDFCIWICDENLTTAVQRSFERLGLKQQNKEPGMILNLKNYQPVSSSAHETITIAADAVSIESYAMVVAGNWSPPDTNVTGYYKMAAPAILGNLQRLLFAVYYDAGQPVSVIEMTGTDEHVIGFYGLATLNSHRGRGIGTAMITAALNKARNLGYRHAVLQASEDGLGIYKRLGFTVVSDYYEFA